MFLAILFVRHIIMFRGIVLLLKRHKVALLVIEPNMQLFRCTKVRYLYYRATSNFLLIYSILDDRVDKLFNSFSLHRVSLGYSKFSCLFINRAGLHKIYTIPGRGKDFPLKYFGKSNIHLSLITRVKMQFCSKVSNAFLNIPGNSFLILLSEILSI